MPYADKEKKRQQMKRWNKEKLAKGYGRWLYARRKLRFDNADRFREALEHIVSDCEHIDGAKLVASKALHEAEKEEQLLGGPENFAGRG